jgi:hypothetical protein
VCAEVIAEHDAEIEAMREDFDQMLAEIEEDQGELAAIAADVATRSQALVERINVRAANFYRRTGDLWAQIGEVLASRLPTAEDFAWVEPEAPDADEEALFDSARGYLNQMEIYKAHSGKPTGRRGGNGNGGAP